MKSFFSEVLSSDIDATICRLIDMPKGVYDKLPGECGSKLLTAEQYAVLKEKGVSRFDLSKLVSSGIYSPRKTIIFNDEFMRAISCEKTVRDESNRPMCSVVIGGASDGLVGWENFGVEFGREGKYELVSYKGARANTKLDNQQLSNLLQTTMSINGGVKNHNVFRTMIANGRKDFSFFREDHIEIPNANKQQTYYNSCMYTGSLLADIVERASNNKCSVFDEFLLDAGIVCIMGED